MSERMCIIAIGLELLDNVAFARLLGGLDEDTPDEGVELLRALRERILEADLVENLVDRALGNIPNTLVLLQEVRSPSLLREHEL